MKPLDPIDDPAPGWPARYLATASARAEFGDRVARLAPFLSVCDPLADAAVAALAERPGSLALIDRILDGGVAAAPEAPAALRQLVEAVERVPVWVDWRAIDRGGRVLVRSGVLGGIVLGAKALTYGYASPSGNKPLVLSGRLRESAPRRLNETSRFVQAVTRPGGLLRQADGFKITVKVRLMHAQVRRMILRSGRWLPDRWGAPINQHDMAATTLLFSIVTLDGLRQLGVHVSEDEGADYLHLWRYVGHLMGVDDELLPATERDASSLGRLMFATQGPPDDDSRALVRALLEASEQQGSDEERTRARRLRPVAHGICRGLIGDTLADQLAIAATPMRHLVPVVRAVVGTLERARRQSRGLERALARLGERYWDTVVSRGLHHATHDFALPHRLAGLEPRLQPA